MNGDMSRERRPSIRNSLSSRLLILTVIFVMLAEVMIFVPSVARYRVSYLEQMLAEANLAALSVLAAPGNTISRDLEHRLLRAVGVNGVVMKLPQRRMLLLAEEMPPAVDATYDLRGAEPMELIGDALRTMIMADGRTLRIIGDARNAEDAYVEIIMPEASLRAALLDYGWNIFSLSLFISIVSATLLFLTLRWMLVRPMRRLTANILAFRRNPEAAHLPELPTGRGDEISLAAHELAEMERDLRQALVQKNHLAALGAAVSKISHDLRNILATSQVISELLSDSLDPTVRRLAPRLIQSLDRAIELCQRSLKYGSADEPPPRPTRFRLRSLVAEVGDTLTLDASQSPAWKNLVADELEVHADRDQLYRVLMNLGRNAAEAAGEEGEVRVSANEHDGHIAIRVSDNGSGVPEKARENLFRPFVGSAREGGTGLGLTIARDLVQAHGGTLELERTGPSGTCFRILLPL
ncbi:histidine kinase [Minwuia thermotolerans]|uniref:histidine kinase n=2 Tax=Minwuia thermotolerans TaxID=2056226 RepID=A0A2M9FWG6_9PROT|nr:histidine kinase [Minwuia thermotolerans]